MSTSRNLTTAVHQEEDWYVAQCLQIDVASQRRTIDEVDDPQQHVTATPLVTSFQVLGVA